jgi:hypothetical protein
VRGDADIESDGRAYAVALKEASDNPQVMTSILRPFPQMDIGRPIDSQLRKGKPRVALQMQCVIH